MKDIAGLAIFAAVLIAAATAVAVQAKHDIASRVLYPVEEAEVLTPVDATDELSPVRQYEVE